MAKITPFHLAIPVSDLPTAKRFYEEVLGCTPGRFSEEWADYSFFGHQLVLHEDKSHKGYKHFNDVDSFMTLLEMHSSSRVLKISINCLLPDV